MSRTSLVVSLAAALGAGALGATGCATARTRPGDMDVGGHEEAARRSRDRAQSAAEDAARGGRGTDQLARFHARAAEAHEAAAAERRAFVERICDRAREHGERPEMRLVRAEAVTAPAVPYDPRARARRERVVGAVLAIEVEEGGADRALAWLRCDRERATARLPPYGLGEPFAVPGAATEVRSRAPGLLAHVTGDPTALEEVLRRAGRAVAPR